MKNQMVKEQSGAGLIYRKTDSQVGRSLAVTPENSPMKHLRYGRIRLDAALPTVEFSTGKCEVGLICIGGSASVSANGAAYDLGRYDSIYIPRDTDVSIKAADFADFVECSAEVEGHYPLQVVRYADVESDPSLKFTTGGAANRRTVNVMLGKNIQAGRILAGVTESDPGNWTSFPPHEHEAILEEIYVYYDMPAPAFGLQMIYADGNEVDQALVVREGDAAVIPSGFHPNVAVPDHRINFVWLMAAHREVEDRRYGVVNVQPGFDKNGTGLEASQK